MRLDKSTEKLDFVKAESPKISVPNLYGAQPGPKLGPGPAPGPKSAGARALGPQIVPSSKILLKNTLWINFLELLFFVNQNHGFKKMILFLRLQLFL